MRHFCSAGALGTLLVIGALGAPGCGDDDGPGPATDAGATPADAGGGGGDAGPGSADGGDRLDGSAGVDGGGVVVDGGAGPSDAGRCVLCTAPLGCVYVGRSCASCGTLVCGDGGTAVACGGLGGGACAASEFCDYDLADLCGAADATGVCRPRPDVCSIMPMPVCGCNGTTYTNACIAHMAGVSVAGVGACP